MKDFSEEIRYGFDLYPFAVLLMLGTFITTTGPAILQSLLSGMSSIPAYTVIVLGSALLVQIVGGVVAAAGFFGALYRVLQDAE